MHHDYGVCHYARQKRHHVLLRLQQKLRAKLPRSQLANQPLSLVGGKEKLIMLLLSLISVHLPPTFAAAESTICIKLHCP